ncbi:hypothetical protein PUN28_006360 [Cardiocondyla obscurior]|uniref:SHSP domain-containing protein n=1 Tax=Cardiocondyla obscurior TaxID=286306 RepID=A0AAW2G8A9_9HYME
MYLLPLFLLSNFHSGQSNSFAWSRDRNPLDPTLVSSSFIQPDIFSHVFDRYPAVNFNRGVLDFSPKSWFDLLNRKPSIRSYIEDNVYKITMNMKRYNAEQISVKVMDRWIVVEFEIKQDTLSQQSVKRFLLPQRANADQVTATLYNDGILLIAAPLKLVNEKNIEIEQKEESFYPNNSKKETRIPQTTVPSDNEKETGPTTEAVVEKKTVENDVNREEVTVAEKPGPKPEK